MTREERETAVKEFKEWRDSYYNKNKLPATMFIEEAIKALEQEPCEDCISRELVLRGLDKYLCGVPFDEKGIDEVIKDLPSVQPKTKTGHCEKCKHFRKLPYHADALGKCIHHTGFCPKGDWHCADYEPQESEGMI